MSPLRIDLLGGLRVVVGETPVTRFRTQRAAALLAFLALHPGRQFSREELAVLLWPDAADESARVSLRTALSHLRAALGDGVLQQVGNRTVGLGPVRTDVAAFEQAVAQKRWGEARHLYQGELLPGFWDAWVLTERERLAALWERVASVEDVPASRAPLPPDADRFWGRDAELALLAEDLRDARTVTVLGPGGIGKTRLALAAARRNERLFPGGLWFVPLAGLRDARPIHATVRDALGIAPDPRLSALEQVAGFLTGDAPCLLILDNLEHLAAPGAAALRALLTRIPNLRLLLTSRRRLGLPDERSRTLGPMGTRESAALFVDRARAATLHPLPAAEVAALCEALEGIPLAIELAAARCASLTVAQIRARLTERFALLTATGTEKTARHRSLHATLAWSFALLTPEQRRIFLGVSVFRGGWTTEAAEAVCDDPNAVEYLAQLRERSLVQQSESGRWHQLETLRAFAQAQPGDREPEERRHYERCLALARAGGTALLREEADNLRAALERADPERHAALALALAPLWHDAGQGDDALPALAQVARAASEPQRFRAWIWLVDFYEQRGDAHAMLRGSRRAVRSARALGDPQALTRARIGLAYAHTVLRRNDDALRLGQAALAAAPQDIDPSVRVRAHNTLGIARYFRDEFAAAADEFAAALEISERIGDRKTAAFCRANLGIVRLEQRRYPEARVHVGAALEYARSSDQPYQIAMHAANLAWIAYLESDADGAARWLAEAIPVAHRVSARLVLRNSLWIRACLDVQTGRPERAARLWGFAARLSEQTGTPIVADDAARQAQLEAQVAAAIGDDALARERAAGAALSLDPAVALALE